jgi:hypothetical protein
LLQSSCYLGILTIFESGSRNKKALNWIGLKLGGKLLAGGKLKDRTWQNLERPLSTGEKSAFYNIFEEYYSSYRQFWIGKSFLGIFKKGILTIF